MPTPVYVGEYPVWGASIATFTRTDDGEIRVDEPPEPDRQRQAEANEVLAQAVIAYIFHGDSRLGGRVPLNQGPNGALAFLGAGPRSS
ncbi:hypothetical protein [Saccharopolyspora elongata]|uniref:Uncharacterized protein n=1 Tax=Saccharopolyspora elongata TaxID=2530387 RepID=A0A4R4YUN6_9PSEU|nr:hypothetical protein [Saccharopolyspora elongata]TDD48174.1 hypothetical protein E1288_23080 [Saccharopolyspora elongata]